MAGLGELPVPATASLGELPVPDTGLRSVSPQDRDAEAFQATAGEARKGLRSSVNSLGAALHAFTGGHADAMGLTDFANERFKEAEEYVKFADEVGPVVKDYRAVKDLNDAAMLAAGLGGEAVGSFAPMVAGGAVAGVRGAVTSMFVPEMGQQLLRTRNSPASPQAKLGAAGVEAAASTALGVAVPLGAASRVAKGVAIPAAKAAGAGAASMGAASAGQEAIRQAAHTAVEPNRDTSEDSAAKINAAIGGGVTGLALGGGAGLASRVVARFQEGRPRTLDEAKSDLGTRDRPTPLDPDITKMPDDVEGIDAHLTEHDTKVDGELADFAARTKDPKYDGWEKDPEKRDALHEAMTKSHSDEVDRPVVKRALDGLSKFMDKWRPAAPEGEKASKRRTALDMAVFDNVAAHLPEHLAVSMTPAEKLQLAEHVKDFALHTAGRKQEQPGPGAPEQRSERSLVSELAKTGEQGKDYTLEGPRPTERVLPHQLMDLFGDKLEPLLTSTQKILMQGGLRKGEAADFKVGVDVATQSRGKLGAGLDDVVRTHIKPEYLEDRATRDYTVRTLSSQITDMVHSGKFDEAKLDHFFGEGKQEVLDAFERERDTITRQYESMDDTSTKADTTVSKEDSTPEGAPKAEDTKPRDQLNPYLDKRLGVAMDEPQARQALDALHSEYDPRAVRFKVEAEEKDNQRTGKFIINAEDAEAKVGFTKEELDRIREQHGKAGHENSVVSVVRKDSERPGRNETAAISIPNLVAETIRSTRRRGDGATFVHDMLMEGLSRLASDPDFVRFSARSEKEGWNFPDDMLVARVKGRDYTWGEVRKESDASRAKEREYYGDVVKGLNDRLESERERGAGKLEGRMKEYDSLRRAVAKGTPGAKEAYNAFVRQHARFKEEAESGYFRGEERGSEPKASEDGALEYPDRVDPGTGMTSTDELIQSAEAKERQNPTPRSTTLDETRPLREKPRKGKVEAGPDQPIAQPESKRKFLTTAEDVRKLEEQMGITKAMMEALGMTARSGESEEAYLSHIRKVVDESLRDPEGLPMMREAFAGWKKLFENANTKDKVELFGTEEVAAKVQKIIEDGEKTFEAAYKGVNGLGKLSEMRMGRERITPEQEAAVRAEVNRLLGPHATVLLKELDSAAGQFKEVSGAELLGVSIHSIDPLGVGRHESMHALLSRLSAERPDVANVLSNAARSPNVVAQLRSLLKDEPAALKQLADHEERAAYMYEFWAAGKLKVGPKAEGLFGQVKDMLQKGLHLLFGLGEDPATSAKAEELLRSFHSGELADKSAAGRVLSRLLPRDQLQDTWLGRLGDWSNRVWSTSHGYIKDMGYPAMTDAINKMYNPGEGPTGYLQARHVARNQYMNRYELATKGLDKAAESRVLETLQSGKDTTSSAAEKSAVKAIKGMLDDLFTYMQEKGVKVVEWSPEAKDYVEHDVQRQPGYFPRAMDKAYIAEHQAEFVAMLKRHGKWDGKDENGRPVTAESFAEKLLRPTKASPEESDFTAGLTHYAPNTMARTLRIPDSELAPFMKKDLSSIMYDYVNYTTRRGEYASRFGNQGQEIVKITGHDVPRQDGTSYHVPGLAEKQGASPEQLKNFVKAMQAMEGSLGSDISPTMRKYMGAMLTYQNFRLLPLSLFSSLIDPLGITVRGGTVTESFGAFTRGIRDLVSTKEDEARQFARAVGAINEATEEHMVSEMYGANYGANWQKWLNDKLFKLNGMESWNNSMRTAGAAAARQFILRHANEPGPHSERYLRELGLEKGDVSVDKDGALHLTPVVVDAVNRWVDGAVLRPHAGIRPIWQSDPHFMLVSHLKQFTYSFQKTINERVVHEAMHGNYTPLAVLASYVPGIMAADVLRASITPGVGDDARQAGWTAWDWFAHAVNRAGISGPGQYALDGFKDLSQGRLLRTIGDVGGPTVQQAADIMHAAISGSGMAKQGLRALPIVPAMGL